MYVSSLEERFLQKARQTVVVAFWGEMAAHNDCATYEFIQVDRANITRRCGGQGGVVV